MITRKKMQTETLLASTSPIYFAENYFKIETLTGVQNITLYDIQKTIITGLTDNEPKCLVGNVARQTGTSSAVNIYALWDAMFNSNKTIALLSTTIRNGSF